MKRSKRFEVLARRPVNQDGLIGEWPEEGLIAMESPFDPLVGESGKWSYR
jgi:glycerol dehydratase large subunit